MERQKLEDLLAGKTIAVAELTRRTVVLRFTDGSRLVREKTYEGLVEATLFDPDGGTLATAILS